MQTAMLTAHEANLSATGLNFRHLPHGKMKKKKEHAEM
jgi:hypothetical protein